MLLLRKTLPGRCAWSGDREGAAGGLWWRPVAHELPGRPRRRRQIPVTFGLPDDFLSVSVNSAPVISGYVHL
jgi:hypothetical protein